MAKLILSYADIQLSKKEKKIITNSLETIVKAESKSDFATHDRRFKRNNSFRTLLSSELSKSGALNFDYLKEKVGRDFLKYDKKSIEVEAGKRNFSRKKPTRKNAVWGLTSGNEYPTYDFNWTYHDVVGSNAAGNFTHIANRATGEVYAYAHCHDSSPRKVDSYAGVGFWYIPNRSGILQISIAPSLRENMWTGALWNDVAIAGGWITLGIASYLRDPFRFDSWRIIDTDRLWYNEDNWFDWTDHDRTRSAVGMNVSTYVDDRHYYACWMWVRAYTYARNGGSYAGSAVDADLSNFSYNLV